MPNIQPYPHLPLIREDRNLERKKRPGYFGKRPDRGGRNVFAPLLKNATARLIKENRAAQIQQERLQSHLVFRLPYAVGTDVNQLIENIQRYTGIEIVSIEPDHALVAFRDELDLDEFQRAVAVYENGPKINPKTQEPYKTTSADFLECIDVEQIRRLSKKDRIGKRLKELIGENGNTVDNDELYIIDLELWQPGGADRARSYLNEINRFIRTNQADGERTIDTFSGQFILLARVAIRGGKLSTLLELNIVAEAELPPQPVFNPIQVSEVTSRDFPTPPRPPDEGPRLCIIDSGITSNHPLLANNVGHEEAIMTQATSPADTNGHGTMVAGLAVYGDVRECYNNGRFASPVTLFSARVLNERNLFDDEKLIINQIRNAIETFYRPPHNCRIFNLSLGSYYPAFDAIDARQTLWAEELDILARELKIVLVIPTGNHYEARAADTAEAEVVLRTYPDLLFNNDTGLSDPATAAIAITVGGLAQVDTPAPIIGAGAGDIVRPVAHVNEPSPMTRIGPGVNNSIKPELVHYSGNLVFRGFGGVRRIDKEPGTAVMSFSHQPTQRLFSYDCGTSFAAPQIARVAALIEHGLTTDLGEHPSANLIRAVLTSTAQIPQECQRLLNANSDSQNLLRICGYGFPDETQALRSDERRATMIYQGSILIDNFVIFAIPIPDAFRYANGERKIIVTLAYDPPVRRRRNRYLGVGMEFFIIRGQNSDQVHDAFKARPSGYSDKFRMSITPNASTRGNSTLQRGECILKRPEDARFNYGDEYYLVVRSERHWAPADIVNQGFGVAVTLCANNDQLYNQVSLRIRQRGRARI